jgi:hypothetical protein
MEDLFKRLLDYYQISEDDYRLLTMDVTPDNFFGFMINSVSWIFLLVILGVSIAAAVVIVLFGPLAQILFGWFSRVKIARPAKANKKAKARPARVKKSAEPEEAIFIGIND